MIESILNGKAIEFVDPLDLMDFDVEDFETVMKYSVYVEVFGERKQNIGHYYNDTLGFGVLFFIDATNSDIISLMNDGYVKVKLKLYRQKIIGEVSTFKCKADTELRFEGWAYSPSTKYYQVEASRANMWIGIDLDDDWQLKDTNFVTIPDATYYTGFNIRGLIT